MPLAFPLSMILMAVLLGCTPSVRSPLAAPADASASVSKTADRICRGPVKGVAEVVELDTSQVWLRFYPGDQLFSLSRLDSRVLGCALAMSCGRSIGRRPATPVKPPVSNLLMK